MSLTTSIVSYWKLDGNSTDAVGTNNGTDTAITYGTSYGKINQGANFNGSTSNINLGNVLGSVFVGANSVCGWMYPTGGSYAELLGKTATNIPAPIDYYANLGTNLYFIAFFGDGSANFHAQTPNNSITLNAWNYVCVTYDGSGTSAGVKIYINGVSQTLTLTGTSAVADSTNSAIIGSRSDAATTITGDIDEVGIWSRALTSTEITQLYNGGAGLQYPFATAWTTTLTEAITNSDTFIKLRTAFSTLAEAVSNTDTIVRGTVRTISEAIANTDTLIRTTARAFSEAVTNSDTIQAMRVKFASLAEAIANADTFLRTITKNLVEAVSNTDTMIRTIARTWAETVTNSDTFSLLIARPLTEAIRNTDVFVRSTVKSLIETVTNSDTFTIFNQKFATFTDAITNTDTFSKVWIYLLALGENITNTPIFTKLINGWPAIWGDDSKHSATFTADTKHSTIWTDVPPSS